MRVMYQFLSEMQIFDRLNSWELALCLLAAYYHDTGMFLTQEEERRYRVQNRRKRSRRREGMGPRIARQPKHLKTCGIMFGRITENSWSISCGRYGSAAMGESNGAG